jgi:hypothetical protein
MILISIMRKWLWVNSRDEVSVDFCLVKMGGCYQFPMFCLVSVCTGTGVLDYPLVGNCIRQRLTGFRRWLVK